jgi:hypothetical protein
MDTKPTDKPEKKKGIDREKLADKVLDIMSDSPEDMAALVELLKSLENNPALHPEKAPQKDPGDTKNSPK